MDHIGRGSVLGLEGKYRGAGLRTGRLYCREPHHRAGGRQKVFGISKSTVHKDIQERLPLYNRSLYLRVKEVLDENKAERHIRGGIAHPAEVPGRTVRPPPANASPGRPPQEAGRRDDSIDQEERAYETLQKESAPPAKRRTGSRDSADSPETPVRRYVHPIQTGVPIVCDPTEQALCAVLDALRRQTELLEELIRRTERTEP